MHIGYAHRVCTVMSDCVILIRFIFWSTGAEVFVSRVKSSAQCTVLNVQTLSADSLHSGT